MKYNVVQWVLVTIVATVVLGLKDPTLLHFFVNLVIAVMAWLLTKRHLWLVDYFSPLASFSLTMGLTIINYTHDCWFTVEGENLLAGLMIVCMYG